MADASVYHHLKTGGWVQALAPSQVGSGSGSGSSGWSEANFYDNFQGNTSTAGDGQLMPDGSYQFTAPPTGKLDHFGPGEETLPFNPDSYDGVYETMSVKSNVANSGLALDLGGDYLLPGEHSVVRIIVGPMREPRSA